MVIGINPDTALGWTDKILETSNKIDKASTGAIVAATGASAVLGFFTGGLGWISFGAFASMLLFRGGRYWMDRDIWKARRRIEIQSLKRIELEEITRSSLSLPQQEALSNELDNLGSTQRINNRQLQ